MNLFEAIILAIIEGITEFLPVSSTGHMIIANSLMGIADDDFVKFYTIAIQFGAILSVVVLYYKRLLQSVDIYLKLAIGFIPAGVLGFLLNDYIDQLLESVVTVGISLLAGGIILLFVDKWFSDNEKSTNKIDYKKSVIIGLFQSLAMIPGVSRSAATIIGGLMQGLSRKSAAEFSFLLAIPTMLAATLYKALQYHQDIGFKTVDIPVFLIGNIVAFALAMLAIKTFIHYLTKYGFRIFGIYRIIVGIIILLLYYFGSVQLFV